RRHTRFSRDWSSDVCSSDLFPFPAVGDAPAVVGGGDVAVAFTDTEATMALMSFLASPEAAEIWVAEGGFTSPNKSVDTSLYPDRSEERRGGQEGSCRRREGR